MTTLLISCGGSKKTTRTATKTKTVSSRKTEVSREVKSVEKPKEVAKNRSLRFLIKRKFRTISSNTLVLLNMRWSNMEFLRVLR